MDRKPSQRCCELCSYTQSNSEGMPSGIPCRGVFRSPVLSHLHEPLATAWLRPWSPPLRGCTHRAEPVECLQPAESTWEIPGAPRRYLSWVGVLMLSPLSDKGVQGGGFKLCDCRQESVQMRDSDPQWHGLKGCISPLLLRPYALLFYLQLKTPRDRHSTSS